MADTTQPAGALPELVTETAPERIWLIIGADCPADARFDSLEEVTWCQDKIDDNSIEYVSADTLRAMMADRDAWRDKAHRTDLLAEKLMAERDAALKTGFELLDSLGQANAAALVLRDERDALRRELEELRAIPPDAREGREPLALLQGLAGAMRDRHYGRMPEDVQLAYDAAWKYLHGIGPAGTSADGETQP